MTLAAAFVLAIGGASVAHANASTAPASPARESALGSGAAASVQQLSIGPTNTAYFRNGANEVYNDGWVVSESTSRAVITSFEVWC